MDLNITKSRLVGIILLGWFAMIGFDFLLHGGILAGMYTESRPFLLSPEKAFQLIPLGYLSFLIFQIFLVWLMIQTEISGGKNGMKFGLKVGAFTWGALCLGLLSISTASMELMVGWFLGQTIEAGIGGLVAGLGFITNKMGRLTSYVVLFFFVAIIITIVLQSTGQAPSVIAQ